MSLRSLAAITALMAGVAMHGQGMVGGRRNTGPKYRGQHTSYAPEPLDKSYFDPIVHKGHTTEMVTFELHGVGFIATITLPISAGSKKALIKKKAKIHGELGTYIAGMNEGDLIRFGQFEILDLPKVEEVQEEKSSVTNNKGDYKGTCHRSACVTKLPALYFNHSTEQHYCAKCAGMINDMNRADSIRLYGHELCVLVKEIDVRTSNGEMTMSSENGIVLKCEMNDDGEGIDNISRFDVKEFRTHYNVIELPTSIDILDLGYWIKGGAYEPPANDWREEFRKEN